MGARSERPRRRGRGRRGASLEPLVHSRVRLLVAQALAWGSQGRLTDADRCIDLALRLCTRYNVRMPAHDRALICRRCRILLLGAERARVRLRGHVIRTCLRCGGARRHKTAPKRPLRPLRGDDRQPLTEGKTTPAGGQDI